MSKQLRLFIRNATCQGILVISVLSVDYLVPNKSFAQAVPAYDISDAIRDSAPPKAALPQEAPKPQITQQDALPFTLPEGRTLFVKAFRLEDAEFVDEAELQQLLTPYQNRDLSMAEIVEAANQVTLYYRSHGYLVARAYIPRQDASAGMLTIRVIVGKYGQFQLHNHSLVNDRLLQAILEQAGKSSALTDESLERAMLLIYDLPGAALPSVTIAPGEAFGTSDLDATVEADKRISGYLLYDNTGSRYTGKNRMSLGLDIASPLGWGDNLSISGMTSERKSQGLESGSLAYSFPLTATGLRATLGASRTTYELGDKYSNLDASGISEIFEATFTYPLIRTRQHSLYLSLNLAHKSLRDELKALDSSTARNIKVARLELRQERFGSLLGFNTVNTLSGGLSFGRLDINNREDRAFNRAGVDTLGEFTKLNLSWSGSLAFTNALTGLASLTVQKSLSGNLDSSEQMSISGNTGVKSYPQGISEDSGYLFNGELRHALPSVLGIDHALGVFFDIGRVYQENAGYSSQHNGTKLKDTGLSYNLSSGHLFGRLLMAHTLGPQENISERNARSRLLAQFGLRF